MSYHWTNKTHTLRKWQIRDSNPCSIAYEAIVVDRWTNLL